MCVCVSKSISESFYFKMQNFDINIFSGIFKKTLNVTCSSKLNSNQFIHVVPSFSIQGIIDFVSRIVR